jgi:hypothetical protein
MPGGKKSEKRVAVCIGNPTNRNPKKRGNTHGIQHLGRTTQANHSASI